MTAADHTGTDERPAFIPSALHAFVDGCPEDCFSTDKADARWHTIACVWDMVPFEQLINELRSVIPHFALRKWVTYGPTTRRALAQHMPAAFQRTGMRALVWSFRECDIRAVRSHIMKAFRLYPQDLVIVDDQNGRERVRFPRNPGLSQRLLEREVMHLLAMADSIETFIRSWEKLRQTDPRAVGSSPLKLLFTTDHLAGDTDANTPRAVVLHWLLNRVFPDRFQIRYIRSAVRNDGINLADNLAGLFTFALCKPEHAISSILLDSHEHHRVIDWMWTNDQFQSREITGKNSTPAV